MPENHPLRDPDLLVSSPGNLVAGFVLKSAERRLPDNLFVRLALFFVAFAGKLEARPAGFEPATRGVRSS
jgi:hypothetical protein